MRTMSHRPWLIIATCLSVSACTDRTVVSEPPTGTDVDATTETTPSSTLGDTLATSDVTLSDPSDAAEPEVSSPTLGTSAANMADVTIESDTQVSSTSQTTTTQPSTEQTASTQANATQGTTAVATDTVTPVTLDDLDQSALETPEISSESSSAVSVETAVAETTPPVDELLLDPVAIPDSITDMTIEPVIIGAPGASVNCDLALPCRWLSDDSQFFVTVTNADNIGAQGRLSIEYSVSSLHDTQVNISNTESAVDSAGDIYMPSALRLGEALGGSAEGIVAGASITASIQFDNASTANNIDYWSIGLSDSGLIRQPVFSGIRIGSATTQPADCANTLPCEWESPAKDVTITLLTASGSGSTSQLSTSFKVETTRDLVLAVDAGATAAGSDGMSYRGRTHSIGIETGAEKLTGSVTAGARLAGSVFFFRTQSMSQSLQNLSLIVYEDSPVPRWNPEFLNVPVQ